MTSSQKSLLDLFMPLTRGSTLDPKQAGELFEMAHQTLASIHPDYQTKGCKCVLDELEARKNYALHDLAVLSYEAITFVQNRNGRK